MLPSDHQSMPAPLSSKEDALNRLLETFREQGFDGSSLADLSAATGLGRSSLYHYFPGGKADMARQVLEHLEAGLEKQLFDPLKSPATPQKKLDTMLDVLDAFYEGGRRACLLERLCASVDRKEFKRPLAGVFAKWVDAVEALCREAGVGKVAARARAEDLVIRIEGALVVCAGMGEPKIFTRTLRDIRSSLLAPER